MSTGSIKRYIRRYKATGSVAATVQRRQEPRISRALEGALRALVAREPLAKLDWYCAAWERETGMGVSIQTMSRMLVRLGLRQKTTVGARERDEAARRDWRERAQTLPARNVVVIDESSTHLDMARRYGRAPRGERVYVKQRRNYGKNVTLLAGLRLDGMTDSMVIEGAVTTAVFEAFVEHILLPILQPAYLAAWRHGRGG